MDTFKYRADEGGVQTVRVQLRLAARNFNVRTGILSLEPVVFPPNARTRSGLSQTQQSELVPAVPDRAGERAGSRRMLLAARNHARRSQRDRTMVSANHEILRRVAGRH